MQSPEQRLQDKSSQTRARKKGEEEDDDEAAVGGRAGRGTSATLRMGGLLYLLPVGFSYMWHHTSNTRKRNYLLIYSPNNK